MNEHYRESSFVFLSGDASNAWAQSLKSAGAAGWVDRVNTWGQDIDALHWSNEDPMSNCMKIKKSKPQRDAFTCLLDAHLLRHDFDWSFSDVKQADWPLKGFSSLFRVNRTQMDMPKTYPHHRLLSCCPEPSSITHFVSRPRLGFLSDHGAFRFPRMKRARWRAKLVAILL